MYLLCSQIVRLSCKRTSGKSAVAGQSAEYDTTCACGAACAKFCSCCACSSACCISFWSCFPCCNLFTCLRSFFCGSQVHPSSGDRKESENDFYIGGHLQDKDAEIVFLKNELREVNNLSESFVNCVNLLQTEPSSFNIGKNVCACL